ncbi:MAG: VUT family protein [Clostridia bacterium]|nr:VUT family protein [Clostridia bacterium]
MSRNTFVSKAKRFFHETILLLRAIPSPVVALFVMSVIAMNLLANKTIFQRPYLAIDGGILVSWLSFLSMDIVTKHFGPRASTRMSLFAIAVNLLTCLIFYIVSIIPVEGEDYTAFNTIIGGTWFILLSSTIAFLCSAIINNFLNYIIGKAFKNNPSGKLAYIARSYISTFIGQFFDNFIFAVLTFMVFAPIFWDGFSWSFVQCVTCSVLGAFLELLFEVIFSPIGYAITKNWEKQNVGKEYFDYIEANK